MSSSARHLRLGVAAIVLLPLLVLGVATGALPGLLHHEDRRTVRAIFADAQQLRVGAPVRLDGVKAGEVSAIARRAAGTVVTMRLDRSAGPLHADATAALRWRTLLGSAFYVALGRGTPAAGSLPGDTIARARTRGQVELDDVASVVRGGARQGLQRLPRALGDALADPAQPAGTLRALDEASPDLARGLAALRGRRVGSDLRSLVARSAQVTEALGRSRRLDGLVSDAATTVDATAAEATAIRTALDRAPAALRDTRATLARLDTTLSLADPLVRRLSAAAPDVAPTLRALRPTVVRADALLRDARPLLRSLRPAVTALRGAAAQAEPLLRGLQPSIDRLERTILPYLAEKDEGTGTSTTVMIGATFASVGGSAGTEDANGHFIRFPLSAGSSSTYLPCQTYLSNPDKARFLECQSLEAALKTVLSYDPLGAVPGTAGGPPAPERAGGSR